MLKRHFSFMKWTPRWKGWWKTGSYEIGFSHCVWFKYKVAHFKKLKVKSVGQSKTAVS